MNSPISSPINCGENYTADRDKDNVINSDLSSIKNQFSFQKNSNRIILIKDLLDLPLVYVEEMCEKIHKNQFYWKNFFYDDKDVVEHLYIDNLSHIDECWVECIDLLNIDISIFKNKSDILDRILLYNSQNGDHYSRDLFITSKTKYIYRMIYRDNFFKKFMNLGIHINDLVQTSVIGLIRMVDKYDFRADCTVKTYMANCIKYTVMNTYRTYGMINISREALSIYHNLENMPDSDNLSRSQKIKKFAEENNLKEIDVVTSVNAVESRNSTFTYTNDGYINTDEKTIGKYIEKITTSSKEKEDRMLLFKSAVEFMKNLTPNEYCVIYNVYLKDITQKEVAKMLNLSEASIVKIKKKALKKLRDHLTEDE